MALPKRKISKTRRDKRRTHWVLNAPAMSPCPKCGQPRLPHRVCPHCGNYKGTEILEVEET
jgi:large subunit ribosomal protein L32